MFRRHLLVEVERILSHIARIYINYGNGRRSTSRTL
jgi:hypothetical protein